MIRDNAWTVVGNRVVRSDAPYKSFAELIEYSKKNQV